MRVVYVDELFAVNLLLDYLLLVLTARLSGVFAPRLRLLLAAALGALLAVLLYFPQLTVMTGLLARAAVCAAVTLAAFGFRRRRFPRLCGLFCAVTFALAGAVSALALLNGGVRVRNGVVAFAVSWRLLLGGFLTGWAALALLSGGALRLNRGTARLTVTLGSRTVAVRALCDSGNLLRDPLTGRQVALLGRTAAAPLLPAEHRALLLALNAENAAAVCAELVRRGAGSFRLMPCRTAAGGALLLTICPERLEIDGKKEEGYLLGISPAELEAGGDCRAVIGV